MEIVLYIVNIILMATVVYFVTRKEEVPEKDDEYLIKGIVSAVSYTHLPLPTSDLV